MVGLEVHGNRRPLPIVAIANELLASLGTPPDHPDHPDHPRRRLRDRGVVSGSGRRMRTHEKRVPRLALRSCRSPNPGGYGRGPGERRHGCGCSGGAGLPADRRRHRGRPAGTGEKQQWGPLPAPGADLHTGGHDCRHPAVDGRRRSPTTPPAVTPVWTSERAQCCSGRGASTIPGPTTKTLAGAHRGLQPTPSPPSASHSRSPHPRPVVSPTTGADSPSSSSCCGVPCHGIASARRVQARHPGRLAVLAAWAPRGIGNS